MRTGALRPSCAGEPGVLDDEVTIARVLSEAGYFTQAVGKWHCGENLASQPQSIGFDDFYGFLGWSGLYTDWQDEAFAPEFALNPERQALVKTVQHLDSIDQSSFLLADDGLSNRKYVYYWLQDTLCGVRVAEYKFMIAGTSWEEQDVVNGESATVIEIGTPGDLQGLSGVTSG